MTPDRLETLLREARAPGSVEARERAVAAARAEIAGRATPQPSRRPAGRRALGVLVASALLAGALLTPPGRAASGWVGELVGIGEVGGSPTLEQHGFEGTSRGLVIGNGRAPDGSRYEWVVYDCKVDLREEGLPTRFEGFGMALEWPGVKGREGGGSCEESGGPASEHAFDMIGVHIVPSQFKGVDDPDLIVSGATGARVDRVRVIYRDKEGAAHDLDVDFARLEDDLRERVGRQAPGGTFVAFVPGDWAARDDVEARLDLRAIATTGKLHPSPFAKREARQAREAMRECAPLLPDPSKFTDPDDREAVERALGPHTACMEERMPPPPIEVIAYDAEGRELERWEEPLALPAQDGPVLPPGPIEWDKRPTHPERLGEALVLAAGRAPDGARWEWYVERLADEDGEVTGICTTLWWPRFAQVGTTGSCGPELPPETAYGRRSPEQVMAKPYGFLTNGAPATKHLMLSGYARPEVARVRVVYGEERRDAPVELVHVAGELGERMSASEPFGYFVAFVPHSARSSEIEVLAYDEGGRELGRVTHHE